MDYFQEGGVTDLITDAIQPLEVIPPWILMILISLFITVITEVIGNSLIVTVFVPIVAKLVSNRDFLAELFTYFSKNVMLVQFFL